MCFPFYGKRNQRLVSHFSKPIRNCLPIAARLRFRSDYGLIVIAPHILVFDISRCDQSIPKMNQQIIRRNATDALSLLLSSLMPGRPHLRPWWTRLWHCRHCPTFASYRNSRRRSPLPASMAAILNCGSRPTSGNVEVSYPSLAGPITWG